MKKFTHRQSRNQHQWFVYELVEIKPNEKEYRICKVFYNELNCKLFILAHNRE